MAESTDKGMRVIAITSGKGGVGKTNASTNLALALGEMGQKVLLMDADLGLSNVDVLLGLSPDRDLADVVEGKLPLQDILMPVTPQVSVIPAASGVAKMADLNHAQLANLVAAFDALPETPDTLIVDTAAGISRDVQQFCSAAQEVVVVVTPDPSSLTDAYALMKVMGREHGIERFHLLANRVGSADEGRQLFGRISETCLRFLDTQIRWLGAIPEDRMLQRAVQQRRPVALAYPGSAAATGFRDAARQISQWPLQQAGNRVQFFFEHLSRRNQEVESLTV